MSFLALSMLCLTLGQAVEPAESTDPVVPRVTAPAEDAEETSPAPPRPLAAPDETAPIEGPQEPQAPVFTPRTAAPAAAIEDEPAPPKPLALPADSARGAESEAEAPASEPQPIAPPVRRDPAVRPAGGGESAAAPPIEPASASLLLSRALAAPEDEGLEGAPLTLKEALGRLASPAQYHPAVKAYWRLACRLAEYHFALQEAQTLEAASTPTHPQERAILTAARAAAEARRAAARLRAAEAQEALAETLLPAASAQAPLPADAPYVGTYRTRFESLFASRQPPQGVRRLHRTMPLQKELIDAQATAVATSETALDQLWDAYSNGQAPLAVLLAAFDDLRQRRREFLQSVQTYNESIADYAMLAVGPGVGREAVVSMLIKPAPRAVISDYSRDVAPVGASQPLRRQEIEEADRAPSLAPPDRTLRDIQPIKPAPFQPLDLP